jgi:hypothetical protein
MRIVLCSECVVIFRIRGPRVIDINAVMTIEVIPIRCENAATIGGAVLNTVLRRLCHETAQRLNRRLALESGQSSCAKTVSDISKVATVNAANRFANISLLLLSVDVHLQNPFCGETRYAPHLTIGVAIKFEGIPRREGNLLTTK